jgi:hypothetical protein
MTITSGNLEFERNRDPQRFMRETAIPTDRKQLEHGRLSVRISQKTYRFRSGQNVFDVKKSAMECVPQPQVT